MSFSPSSGSLTHLTTTTHIPISKGILTDCFPSRQPTFVQKFQWLEGNEISFPRRISIRTTLKFSTSLRLFDSFQLKVLLILLFNSLFEIQNRKMETACFRIDV
jgi:hypothetical protein